MALAIVVIGLALAVEGCTTYQQQKADMRAGGPERRVREAEQRQQAVQDAGIGLDSDRVALEEELNDQDQQIAALNDQLLRQEQAIQRARQQNRISREKEQALRDRVRDLDREVREAELRMLSAQTSGSVEREQQMRAQLKSLQGQANILNREIDSLSK